MLNAEQIKNAQFTLVAKGAYRSDEVDSFLNTAASDYAQLTARNEELMKKMTILANTIEQYRAEEDSIKTALISAERLAKTIRNDAQAESDRIIAAAQEKAQGIIDDSKAQGSGIIEDARKNASDFVERTKKTVAAYTEKAKNDTNTAISAANDTAAKTVSDAEAKAASIIGDSEMRFKDYTEKAALLKQQILVYKEQCTAAYTKQMALLDEIELDGVYEVEIPEVTEEAAPVVEAVPEIEIDIPEADEDIKVEPIFDATSVDADVTADAEEIPVAEESAADDDIFSNLFTEDKPAEEENDNREEEIFNDVADIFVASTEEKAEDEEEEFTGFKIDLDGIDDEEPEQSSFAGFFD